MYLYVSERKAFNILIYNCYWMPKLQHDKTNDRYHTTIPKDLVKVAGMVVGSTLCFSIDPHTKQINVQWLPKKTEQEKKTP